jgi:nicotinate-nucleotide adenylyltransferase
MADLLPSRDARRMPEIQCIAGSASPAAPSNPAHDGHRHISLLALQRLADEVWWLVSPQNPLKPAKEWLTFARRIESARKAARHPRIRVS